MLFFVKPCTPLYSKTRRRLQNNFIRFLLGLPRMGPPPPSEKSLYLLPSRQETSIEWHRRHARYSEYRLVAPDFCGTLSPCPLNNPEVEKEPLWQIRDYEVPASFTLDIPYGRVLSNRGVVVTHDRSLLIDFSRECGKKKEYHSIFSKPPEFSQKPKRFRGHWAVIASHGNCTYHWLLSTLTRIEVLRRAGYNLNEFNGFLARKPKYAAHLIFLEKAGIPLKKIRWCTANTNIEAERLIIPSFSCNETRQNQPFIYPFLESLVGDDFAPPARRLRLYISREDTLAPHRRIVNEGEVIALLQTYGFTKVTLAELNAMEQARLFASAEMVVAPHGGGLANLVFTRPPAKVLEIFGPDYLKLSVRSICQDKGLAYKAFIGEHVFSSAKAVLGHDIRVDLPGLQKALEELFDLPHPASNLAGA